MRLALAFGSTLLAAANAFPDKASAEDIQTALGDANSTSQSTPDPDGLVSFADERFTNWRHAAQDHCLQPEETPDSIGEDILKTVTDYMRRSALTDRLFHDMEDSQFTICLAAPGTMPSHSFAIFMPEGDVAMIDPLRHEANAVAFGLHEARHGWQDVQGAFERMPTDSRQDRFAALYMIEADATAFSVAAAYQLKQQGEPGAWQALAIRVGYTEVVKAFEASVSGIDEGRPLTDAELSRGMLAAYNAWFDNTNFPADFGAFQAERWAHYPDRSTDKTAELRQIGQIIGQLPGTHDRQASSYIGPAQVAKAVAFANQLVPMKTPAPQEGGTAPRVERQP